MAGSWIFMKTRRPERAGLRPTPYRVRVGEPRRQENPIFVVSPSQSQCRPIGRKRSIDPNVVGASRRGARPGRPEGKKAGPQSRDCGSAFCMNFWVDKII